MKVTAEVSTHSRRELMELPLYYGLGLKEQYVGYSQHFS